MQTITTRDYSKSPTPQFDAVQDIVDWLGTERYLIISLKMMKIKDHYLFHAHCNVLDLNSFQTKAWYESLNGQGTWIETGFPE